MTELLLGCEVFSFYRLDVLVQRLFSTMWLRGQCGGGTSPNQESVPLGRAAAKAVEDSTPQIPQHG